MRSLRNFLSLYLEKVTTRVLFFSPLTKMIYQKKVSTQDNDIVGKTQLVQLVPIEITRLDV